MKKLNILIVMSFTLIIAFGCKNQRKQNADGFQFEEKSTQSDIEVTKSFIYLFPSPGELLDRFYDAELPFDAALLHSPEMDKLYLTSRDQGLNLGIYLTDMAYSALFSRTSEAIDYLEVVKKLSAELNVSSTAFESLINRAKNNVSESDSLITISNEVFFNMVEFLESSGKENTVAVISCGAYVESLFLALNSVEEYSSDDPIIKQIAEMKYPMENLLSHAESVSDDPNVQSILEYIKDLNGIFEDLQSESSKTEKSEPGVISFTGGSSPDLNKENFDQMKGVVVRIREQIIGQ